MSKKNNSNFFYHNHDDTKDRISIDLSRVLSFVISVNDKNNDLNNYELIVKFTNESSAEYIDLTKEVVDRFEKEIEEYHDSQKELNVIVEKVMGHISTQIKKDFEQIQKNAINNISSEIETILNNEINSFREKLAKTSDSILGSSIEIQKEINKNNNKQLAVIEDVNERYASLLKDVDSFSNKIGQVVSVVNNLIPNEAEEILKQDKYDSIIKEVSNI